MGSIPLVSTNQSTKAIVSVLFFYANFLAIFCYNYNAMGAAQGAWSGSVVMICRRKGANRLHFVAGADKIAENSRQNAVAQHLLKSIGERGSHRVGSVQKKRIKKDFKI